MERYGDGGLVGLSGPLAGASAAAHYWHVSASGRDRQRPSIVRHHPRAGGKQAECRATARAVEQAARARLLHAAVSRECAARARHHAAPPAHGGPSALLGQAGGVSRPAWASHPHGGTMAVSKASV